MDKRILVISYIALMASEPNGRTMQSLLQGIPYENISLFYCVGVPDKESCSAAYKVTNRDALNSMLNIKPCGGEIYSEVYMNSKDSFNKDIRQGKKYPLKYLIRELIWKTRLWRGKKLKSWLKAQNPDCIVYMYGDGTSLQDFAVYTSRLLNIPLIVYSCEDYYFKNYNYINRKNYSLAFKLYHMMSVKATMRLFRQVNTIICNSDELGADYKNEFGIKNVYTVMMASNMESRKKSSNVEPEHVIIAYLGSLSPHRINEMIDIANALSSINNTYKLDIYGKTNDSSIEIKLKSNLNLVYHGYIDYNQVADIMYNCDLLVQMNNFSDYSCRDLKHAFSTKCADSYKCGTPFMIYSPEELIETKFALKHKCAFVATKKDELVSVLKEALFNIDAREEQLKNARLVTDKYFNKELNIKTVNTAIEKALTDFKQ